MMEDLYWFFFVRAQHGIISRSGFRFHPASQRLRHVAPLRRCASLEELFLAPFNLLSHLFAFSFLSNLFLSSCHEIVSLSLLGVCVSLEHVSLVFPVELCNVGV